MMIFVVQFILLYSLSVAEPISSSMLVVHGGAVKVAGMCVLAPCSTQLLGIGNGRQELLNTT